MSVTSVIVGWWLTARKEQSVKLCTGCYSAAQPLHGSTRIILVCVIFRAWIHYPCHRLTLVTHLKMFPYSTHIQILCTFVCINIWYGTEKHILDLIIDKHRCASSVTPVRPHFLKGTCGLSYSLITPSSRFTHAPPDVLLNCHFF